jgi:hypothetical protein
MSVLLVEHPDAAEALDVLRSLGKWDAPEPIGVTEHMTIVDGSRMVPLTEVVAGYLPRAQGKELFDALPIDLLRGAVGHAVARATVHLGNEYLNDEQRRAVRAEIDALEAALSLREQRDRIAADLADMERIGAMTVEEPPVCEHDKVFSRDVLCSMPPQYPWICRKCKARGADYGSIDDNGEDYNRLAREAKQ